MEGAGRTARYEPEAVAPVAEAVARVVRRVVPPVWAANAQGTRKQAAQAQQAAGLRQAARAQGMTEEAECIRSFEPEAATPVAVAPVLEPVVVR